jgi:putative FmdB family regulatory protein
MPTYEFHCNNCDNNFEKWFSMTEEHKTNCPNCGSDNVRKVFSAGSGILFKGSGFYCTDYKDKKKEEKNSCCSNNTTCSCSNSKTN